MTASGSLGVVVVLLELPSVVVVDDWGWRGEPVPSSPQAPVTRATTVSTRIGMRCMPM
jgi:hypothetical protein